MNSNDRNLTNGHFGQPRTAMRWGFVFALACALLLASMASSAGSGVPTASAASVEIVSVTLNGGTQPGFDSDGDGISTGGEKGTPATVRPLGDIEVFIVENNGTWKATEWAFDNGVGTTDFGCESLPESVIVSDPNPRETNLTIQAPDGPSGSYDLTIIIHPNANCQGTNVATLTLGSAFSVSNSAPLAATVPDQTGRDEEQGISVDASTSDVDGDALTYSATGLPAGLSIDTNTGLITGTLDSNASQGGPASDGVYTVEVTADDGNGGAASYQFTWTVSIDTTPPMITPTVTGTLGNNGWHVSNVEVSWTVTDSDTAIISTSGCETGYITTDTAGTTITCAAVSFGGTASESVTIQRDSTAPTIIGNAPPDPNVNGWNNTDVTVSYYASDSLSGIDAAASDLGDDVLTSEGSGQSASGAAVDLAGNSASVTVGGINIDKTAPTTTGSASPDPNVNGWNNTDVIVSYYASDSLSGIDAAASDLGDDVLTSEGSGQSASGAAVDLAGNSASVTVGGINIDKTAPTTTGSASPDPNVNGWNNTDVTVSYYASDSLSGIDAAASDLGDDVLTSEGSGQSASGAAVDLAGNFALVTVGGINIDKTAPTTTGSASPDPNVNGWNNTDVIVSYYASDSLSGIDAAASDLGDDVLTSEGSGQSASGAAVDLAGNFALVTVGGINIDKTAPAVTPAPDQMAEATEAFGANVSYPAATATDEVGVENGPSCTPFSGSMFPLGTTTVTCTATDAAGNLGSARSTVTVRDTTAPVVTVPADITAEPTSASGAAVVFATTANDIVSGRLTTTCAPASGSIIPIGVTTGVSCSSMDSAGNANSATFTITVLTSEEVIERLIAEVDGLVLDTLTQGQANSLTAKLAGALNHLNKGSERGARAKLNDFINQVNNYISSGKLTPGQGQSLIDSATNARNAISEQSIHSNRVRVRTPAEGDPSLSRS